jgi:hypothetical protein
MLECNVGLDLAEQIIGNSLRKAVDLAVVFPEKQAH